MHDLLTLVSICFVSIPTVASMLTFRHYRMSAIMFTLFLSGIVTEQVMFHDRAFGERFVFDVYCLLEFAIFLWIVNFRRGGLMWKSFVKGMIFVALPLWLFCVFVFPALTPVIGDQNLKGPELFNSVYQVIIAFLAALELLRMVEIRHGIRDFPPFWILLGIFVYSFGTFFEMIFLRDVFAQKIWYVHNAINILVYIIYTIGLLMAYKLKVREKHLSHG